MNAVPAKLSFTLALLLLLSTATFAQPDIRHGDGSPLQSVYCYDNNDIQLLGIPSGGTFSGCGVFPRNGKWYFNPAITGGAYGGVSCSLKYSLGNYSTEKTILIHNRIQVFVNDDGIICGDTFWLHGDMLPVGDYGWNWTGPGILNPGGKNTLAVLPAGSRGAYVFHVWHNVVGCERTDTVVIETREKLDFRFNVSDTVVTSGTQIILETRANRGYRVTGWKPAALFPDQAALQQSVTIDTPTTFSAIAESDDGCIDSTRIRVTAWAAGISRTEAGRQTIIYPNPAGSSLHISHSAPGVVVQICDLTGKTILLHQVSAADETLDIRTLRPGIYLVYLPGRNDHLQAPLRLIKSAE